MKKKKVTFAGGHVVVRESTGQDELAAQIIQGQLVASYPNDARGFWDHFALLCSQTAESEGLSFKPEAVAKLGVIDQRAAYEAYLRTPTAFRRKWTQAVNALNADDTVQIEDIDDPNP
jgi:hypothetical protein